MTARTHGRPKGLHYLLAFLLSGAASSAQAQGDRDPHDATSWAQLSQTLAVRGRPSEALEAIERAYALSPESVEFLRARATLATWSGDYGRARDSYERLAKLLPDDHDVVLNLARVAAWAGKTDAAVDAYARYLRLEPDAAAAWIELARTEGWRGNYGAALRHLDEYEARFGGDEPHAREIASVLARAGRPDEALDTLEPLLRQHPDDYELNLTRTVALTTLQRRREAAASLKTVRRLQPDTKETHSAERLYRTALAPVADPAVTVYSDSSTLTVERLAPRVTMRFAAGTTLAAGSENDWLTARRGSGLEQFDGTENARHDHVWVSAAQQFGRVAVRGRIGQARTAARDLTAYEIAADLRPADGFTLFLERDAGFFVVSPRTIGLGLSQVSHRATLEWSPAIRWQIAADVWRQALSDGNHRWEFTVSPRHSLARTERMNLDLGFTVSQLRTTTNYDNGYYDPSRYEFYAVTAHPYWKASENTGLGLSLAVGAQRDDFSPRFRPGGHATAEATFGIYDPWALKVSAGGTFNQRLGSGAFRGYGAGVTVIRRF
jgi:tetratricopeptide (TPR) repeat protein